MVSVIRSNELILPAEEFEVEQVARSIRVRKNNDLVLELEFGPPDTVSVNRFILASAEGVIFIGRRTLADPLSGAQTSKSVLEFQHASGAVQTFVNCGFRSDLGLNLSLQNGAMVISSMVI